MPRQPMSEARLSWAFVRGIPRLRPLAPAVRRFAGGRAGISGVPCDGSQGSARSGLQATEDCRRTFLRRLMMLSVKSRASEEHTPAADAWQATNSIVFSRVASRNPPTVTK